MPIPIAERNYDRLIVASDGALLYLSRKQPGSSQEPPAPPPNRGADADLYRYSFEDRSEKQLRSSLVDVTASADRKKLLLVLGENQLDIADAAEKLDSKPIELNGLRMLVDPHQEWQQIFDEVWRMERAYFYDPNMHGLDWRAVRARYEPLLKYVQRREDLTELVDRKWIGEDAGRSQPHRRRRHPPGTAGRYHRSARSSRWRRVCIGSRRSIAATVGIPSSCHR